MKKSKKLLSIILAILMIISIIPITASAEAPTSGTCGDNLTWSYDDSTYTLTISGTGAMTDYSSSNRPWKSYVGSIKTVVIEDSVTSIGEWAFADCTSLTSVTIPDSVTSIGDYAFCSCDSLTSITVDSNNEYYSSDEYGVLFNKDKTELIQYPIGNTRTSYTIPDSVTSIGSYAFYYCGSLTSVTIPDSVTSIGSGAFSDCGNLTSVIIPDSVTSIGAWAFESCTSIESVTFPDSVTSIGYGAFYNCTSLTSVTIGNSVTSIGDYAFHSCYSLTSVIIGNSVTSIGNNVFRNCTSLTSVTIPGSVTSIGDEAFRNCTSLTDVYYSGTEEQWNSISIGSYNGCLTNATIHYNSAMSDLPNDENQESENTNITVSINESNLDAYIGEVITISVSVSCEEGNISDYPLLSTVNSDIVSFVSQSCIDSIDGKSAFYLVRLVPNATGSCTFTASAGDSSDSCTITVKEPEMETKLTAGLSLTPSTINYYSKNNVDFNEITVNCRITNTISSHNGDVSEIKNNQEYEAYVSSVKIDLSDTNYVTIDDGSSITIPVDKTLKAGEGTAIQKTIKVKDKIKLNDDVDCANVTVTATVSAASDGNSKTLTPSRQISINNKNYVVKQDEEHSKNAENAYNEFEDLLKNKDNCMVLGPSANYIFTEEERKEVAEILFMQMLLQTIPEESLVEKIKERLDNIIYDDVTGEMDEDFKESLDKLLNDYDLDVDVYSKDAESSIIISTKKYGDVKITAKTSVNKTNLSDKEIASWGQVTYTYEGENLPAGVTNYDQGYMSSVDVDGFVEAAQEVVLDEIEEMYNNIYGDDLNEVADMLFGQTGKKIIQAGGYDSVSNMVYEAAAYPTKIYCAKCPVNIFVYDSENNICASVENDVVTLTSDKAQISVDGDEKTVKLYDDTYRIVAQPTGDGVMNVSIKEYANSRGLIKTININDIPLEFGKNYTSTVDMEIIGDTDRYALTSESDSIEILPDEIINNLHYHIDENSDDFCDICINRFVEETAEPEYNYTFSIQTPSTTTIRHKDGIKLHANIEGTAPAGSYVEWTASNGKFKTEEINEGNSLKIVSDSNGKTTFTATLYSADGEVLATDTIDMKSKAGFFDKFGSFFRSLFGSTKIYEY